MIPNKIDPKSVSTVLQTKKLRMAESRPQAGEYFIRFPQDISMVARAENLS